LDYHDDEDDGWLVAISSTGIWQRQQQSGCFAMHESDDDTPFTDHLLDQFAAYYTITAVAVQLFAQWRAHHTQTQMQQTTSPKT
jgi:hypothetical protein